MLTHFSITQQGLRHIEKGVPCQDFSQSCRIRLDRLDCELALAAIADGVGSCLFSQCGSETAVNSFLSCLTHNLSKDSFELSDASVLKLLEHAFRYALYQVTAKAKEMELPFMEFDSTLTGVVFDGKNLWFGHVGDDGIVAMYTDGTYEMITERHEGEEAGSLYPLCFEEKWQFGKAPKEVASLVLMTDGVLNYCVDGKAMKNRVFFPFLKPALTVVMETDEQVEKLKQRWEELLRGASGDPDRPFPRVTTDDITLVSIGNTEAVTALPKIEFDLDQWKADTKKRREELNKVLYADYWEYKEKNRPRRNLNGQEAAEGKEAQTSASKDNWAPVPEEAPPARRHQGKKEESDLRRRATEKSIRKKSPKFKGGFNTQSTPTWGTVVPTSNVRFSRLILDAFELAHSAGKELGEDMSQIFRKWELSEQKPQTCAPEPETEWEEPEVSKMQEESEEHNSE